MKKSTLSTIIVIVIIIIVGIVWYSSSSHSTPTIPPFNANGSSTPVASTATVKVSDNLTSYQNAELGFSLQYPTAWEKDETNAGPIFIMPIDKTQVSTVAKLEADIGIVSGKCSFPPVTTIQDHGTLQSGSNTFNMISISNTVQGRGYFNRMYSLQNGDVCYIFTFSSITLAPDTKGLTGSNVTQAQNNNKAIINMADSAFTDMVKSFTFIPSATGIDETKAPK